MYKLYDMQTRKLLDKSMNEKDIIDSLSELLKDYVNFEYRIIYHSEELNQDVAYKKICSMSDFYHYVNDYNVIKNTEQLKQMSCLELKKEILDLSDKPRIRIKRIEKQNS